MTDQPKQGNDGTPEGYQPPSDSPPQGSGEQYTQPAPEYTQPADPFGATGSTAPQQPYGAWSGQPSGQEQYSAPAQYGQPGSPFNAYGQPAYYGLPPEPKSLSIASLCCGIAVFVGPGFFLLPQLAAVILGHMALRREPAGRGMASAGLVLGYVGIALTVMVIVLIALVLAMGASGGTAYRA
ncbi:DUF4190 domain-containing protein [Arthrobacter sp. CG_A4]|uniref:DUF4190 domain-containing protein n=1 Tax=Arthrobacter sp. CG_A4 TaxID=3071706 RepID=UPI002E0334FD|nr:hypothetical protein [Arthrobacter sp. CG_A4]